jgi:adenosine/AMP kinase
VIGGVFKASQNPIKVLLFSGKNGKAYKGVVFLGYYD